MSKDKKKVANTDVNKKISNYKTTKIKHSKLEITPIKKTKTDK